MGIACFEIRADVPASAVQFYREVFGWGFTKQEELPIPYWRIETDGIRRALLKRPAPTPSSGQGTNAYVCSVEVDGLDAVAEKIIENGGQLALEKFAVPGVCWQGYFIDPEGNTFGLFQPDCGAK
ncbi:MULTISPECIES: VOC family protein [unclassified Microbulbifer]|uniref:VOC family protein n=1 Tax=unclassified Microbulbifer TaxID=2619833 RepID=UPI0027E485F1|nr:MULTISPECIES: VOC family protein [unclassified Microbulbifer]